MKITDIITRKGEPFGKLTVFPITMRHYEEFMECRVSISLMQKRFPVELMQMPYLRMLCVISDAENRLLEKLSMLLSLALQVSEDSFYLSFSEQGKVTLTVMQDGAAIETISELRFSALRRLIAAQNGIRLPNEQANLEILESEEDLARMKNADLEESFQSLLFSVATYSGLSISQLIDMTIFEFQERVSAISRIENYKIYTAAEMGGIVTFKQGNPFPSWCFDRKENGLHGTIPLKQFMQNLKGVAGKQ